MHVVTTLSVPVLCIPCLLTRLSQGGSGITDLASALGDAWLSDFTGVRLAWSFCRPGASHVSLPSPPPQPPVAVGFGPVGS